MLILRVPETAVRAATRALSFVAIALVAFNLVPIAQRAFAHGAIGTTGPSTSAVASVPAATTSDQPDIWYLVFDRYAGQDALDEIYGFDNRPFLGGLEDRGFTVVEHATANYLKTAHSLASTLAMDYLDTDVLAAEAASPDDWTPLYRRLQGSYPVEEALHERGYAYTHLGVRRGATYTNSAAERVLLYSDHTEFSAVLVDTTLLVAFEHVLDAGAPRGIDGIHAHSTQYQFNVLEQMAGTDSATPRFVLAHFLLPHPPYVFNADGSWVTPQQKATRSADEAYLQQVRYANSRILRLLDVLLEDAGGDGPVVLIQADEGPFPDRYAADELDFEWLDATDDELLEKFSILAAYRLPGATPHVGLTATTTPVNSFRIIFNALFDADQPLLPDRNFVFPTQRDLYELVDVTDRVATVIGATARR